MSNDAGPVTAHAAIYLDHNATTPIAPEVLDAMRPYLEDRFGNPSSAHRYGVVAHQAIEHARAQVAALLGCEPDSVVFTAGGSEADNLAIKGVALGLLGDGDHIITSAIEHPAVLGACRYRKWLALARPAAGELRHPIWLFRPVKPVLDAYSLPQDERTEAARRARTQEPPPSALDLAELVHRSPERVWVPLAGRDRRPSTPPAGSAG